MKGVGVISAEDAIQWGLTGPSLRGSGVAYDVRKARPYAVYDRLDFEVPIGTHGDVYDRFLVRMEEMRQSLKLITQASGPAARRPRDDRRYSRGPAGQRGH